MYAIVKWENSTLVKPKSAPYKAGNVHINKVTYISNNLLDFSCYLTPMVCHYRLLTITNKTPLGGQHKHSLILSYPIRVRLQ